MRRTSSTPELKLPSSLMNMTLQVPSEDEVQHSVHGGRPRRKLRVLALHGFGQSGDYLRLAMKTRQITRNVEELLSADLLSQYDGIEWLCPDGPIKLVPDANYDLSDPEDVKMCAWWRVLDFDNLHENLYQSLNFLSNYLRENGPVDGVVGFSQGASIGMMLNAWCEGTPERLDALATQGSPFLMEPPQTRFKFAVSCCGFQQAEKYCRGFYSPKIISPSLQIVAEFDTMVSAEQTRNLADVFEDASTIHFRGTHHVPTDRATIYEIARFIATTATERPAPSPLAYALPSDILTQGDMFSKTTSVRVHEVYTPGFDSPLSSLSSSSASSLSSYPTAARKTHMRVISRSSALRRVAIGRTNSRDRRYS